MLAYLMQVYSKYLGFVIDNDLHWSSHISALCKKTAYYLYLIDCHQSNLPVAVLKMLVHVTVSYTSLISAMLCLFGVLSESRFTVKTRENV